MKNTGTYNSQWTILDLSKFQESINKKTLENETIFVLDQFPGQYHYEDITKYLQKVKKKKKLNNFRKRMNIGLPIMFLFIQKLEEKVGTQS